jgi:hypothetical protein
MDNDVNNDHNDKNDEEIGVNYAPVRVNSSNVLPKTWESVLWVDTYLDCEIYCTVSNKWKIASRIRV